MSCIYAISNDTIENAYATAINDARIYSARADMIDKIAAAIDGATCNKRIADKAAAALPFCRVYYYSASYSNDKYIRVNADNGDCFELRAARKGDKRINAAGITDQAAYYRNRAREITAAAEEYYSNVQQYNALAAYVTQLQRKIRPVINCIDHNF